MAVLHKHKGDKNAVQAKCRTEKSSAEKKKPIAVWSFVNTRVQAFTEDAIHLMNYSA